MSKKRTILGTGQIIRYDPVEKIGIVKRDEDNKRLYFKADDVIGDLPEDPVEQRIRIHFAEDTDVEARRAKRILPLDDES